jgi:hypothetical protein
MAKKLILKLKLASVGSRNFPSKISRRPTTPTTSASLNVFTDDITEINGDTSLRGEHSGFCFHVRQISGSARRSIRCRVSGKSDSGTAVKFRLEDASTLTRTGIPWQSPEERTITVGLQGTSR